jgi:hypothetical protein
MWILGKEKAQPVSQLGWVVVCGGIDTAAYCFTSNGSFHLLPVNGIWTVLSLLESIRDLGYSLLWEFGGTKGKRRGAIMNVRLF